MRQSLVKTPFHRRIIPWVYIAAFIGIAPVVVFFTAGYRINPKKGTVEHTSTALIDSTPTGATVIIDGETASKKTPVALQNILPGVHRFHVEKDGYHSFDKSIEANPERAIFLNTVHLWPDVQPTFVMPTVPTSTVLISSTGRRFVLQPGATSTISELLANTVQRTIALPNAYTSSPNAQFSPDGTQLLIQSSPWSSLAPMGVILNTILTAQKLPASNYRWVDSSIVGVNGTKQTTISLTPSDFQSASLGTSTIDTWSPYRIETSTTTKNSLELTDGTTRVALPVGTWTFADMRNQHVMLRSGSDLLSVDLTSSPARFVFASGDVVKWLRINRVDTAILQHLGEVWMWDVSHEPVLIERQSEPIVSVAWDVAGNDIFLATKQSVTAINLDDRDGYLKTPLMTFDRIWSMDADADTILVTGTRDGKTGIWSYPLNP